MAAAVRRRAPWATDVDQHRPCSLRGVGMAELELGELLQMVVQQPGMVERPPAGSAPRGRDRGAMAAMHRARRQLRARRHVGLAAGERRLARRRDAACRVRRLRAGRVPPVVAAAGAARIGRSSARTAAAAGRRNRCR